MASERVPRGDRRFEREIFAAAAATRHAVSLGLVTDDEAAAIWATVARRHPASGWCRSGPRLAA